MHGDRKRPCLVQALSPDEEERPRYGKGLMSENEEKLTFFEFFKKSKMYLTLKR